MQAAIGMESAAHDTAQQPALQQQYVGKAQAY